MPNNKPTATYNPEHGGSHMDIEPLDPRQGPVKDLVDPTFTDKALPSINPGVQQPMISPEPAAKPGAKITNVPVKPDEWGRAPGYSGGVTKI